MLPNTTHTNKTLRQVILSFYCIRSFPTHLLRRRPSLWWHCFLLTTFGTTQAANRNVRKQKLGIGYYPTHMVTTFRFLLCGVRTPHTAAESCSSRVDQAGQAASKTGAEKIS
jgi:hypothetical protein